MMLLLAGDAFEGGELATIVSFWNGMAKKSGSDLTVYIVGTVLSCVSVCRLEGS